ncbi:hypothetical protein BU17DRAFT_91123 [Hysterangium stoloniferum]|nr:hypothetical protein BU17DRAFT_91123 [Hysterangium stoloniferum]
MEYVNFDLDLDMDMRFPNVDMTKDIALKAQSQMGKLAAEHLCSYDGSNTASTSRYLHDSNTPFDAPLLPDTLHPLTITRAGASSVPGILFDLSLSNTNHNYRSTVLSPIAGPLFLPGENMPPLPVFETLPSTYHTDSPVHQPMSVAFGDVGSSPERAPVTPSLEITSDEPKAESGTYTPNTSGKRKRTRGRTPTAPIIQRKSDTRGRAAPKLSELAALDGMAGPRREVCDYCSTCFNRGEHKVRHMASVHGIGAKYHFCPATGCKYKANRVDNLRQHALTHNSSDLPDDFKMPASKRRRLRQLRCPAEYCSYRTTKKGELHKHMESSSHTEGDFNQELVPAKRTRSGRSAEAISSAF